MREIVRESRRAGVVGGRLDDWIRAVSPTWALSRASKRARAEASVYQAASAKRIFENWFLGEDEDWWSSLELPEIRKRCRDLVRNNPTAAGIALMLTSRVMGLGLSPQPSFQGVRDLSEDRRTAWREAVDDIWVNWSLYGSADERRNFWRLQRLAFRRAIVNGDSFLVRKWIESDGRPFATAYQLISADRVANPTGLSTDKKLRNGIRFDVNGKPTSFYIRQAGAGGFSALSFDEVPAYGDDGVPNVLQLMIETEDDQSRGVPLLTPAVATFKQMSDYIEAMLVRARVEACISGFVRTTDAAGTLGGRTATTDQVGGATRRIEDLAPGMIEYLNPGEEIDFLTPRSPGNQFEIFIKRLLRGIGASIGEPYEFISQDFSESNYSQSRLAVQLSADGFATLRAVVAEDVCQPVLETVVREAALRGMISEPEYLRRPDDFTRARWVGPSLPYINPVQEAQAHKLGLETGEITLADICLAQGKDWRENLNQRLAEEKLRRESGLAEMQNKSRPKGEEDDQGD